MMKLAICVVYLVCERDEQLLDLHLKYIEENTKVEYTIYASVNRLLPKFKQKLEQQPKVKICDCSETSLRGSAEHAFYLDQLVHIATEDGNTYICTFDVDSFPISPNWTENLAKQLSDSTPLAAILRQEVGDTILPHPSCTFFHRNFYLKYHPTFLPSEQELASEKYQQFLKQFSQFPDTGIGNGFILYENNYSWYKLLRSNQIEDHYLLGGIYDSMIFHLGASNRSEQQINRRQDEKKLINKMLKILSPIKDILYKSDILLINKVTKSLKAYRRKSLSTSHTSAYEAIRKKLLEQPEFYINRLKTGH
jgi:hypothetical protein